jgi:hypothetical protein
MMKKLIVFAALVLSFNSFSQSISFGVEVMPRKNFFLGGKNENEFNFNNPEFILLGSYGDSTNFSFTQLNTTGGTEIPMYFRFRAKKRWTFDFAYSLSKYSVCWLFQILP